MFLDTVRSRNAALIEAAIGLHRSGTVPSNSYVVDIDTVEANASVLAARASKAGLELYQMTKQFGRNPAIATVVARSGIPHAVAVDVQEARVLHTAGIRVGNVGHLVQVPRADAQQVLAMTPRFVTVFGVENARWISDAAKQMNREQPLLLRVVGPEDFFYPGQRGGIPLGEVVAAGREIQRLPGVTVAGVTSFPCLQFDDALKRLQPTPNLRTIAVACRLLCEAEMPVKVINAPGVSCCSAFPILVKAGATLAEPGSALIGETPLHAVRSEPEVPALVYVTEVSHRLNDVVYTIGGGFYRRGRAQSALVATSDGDVFLPVVPDPPEAIDYYGALDGRAAGQSVRTGDTCVYAFRVQAFVSRSFVAPVEGIRKGRPSLVGLFDAGGRRIDATAAEREWPGRRESAEPLVEGNQR